MALVGVNVASVLEASVVGDIVAGAKVNGAGV